MYKIIVDAEKCSGCRICEAVCSTRILDNKGFNRKMAAIRVLFKGELEEDIRPVVCKQCKRPLCAKNCPTESISRDVNGIIQINKDSCIGCGNCAQDCPFGAMVLHPDLEVPSKCDLCQGDPLCVKYCVTGALRFISENAVGIEREDR